MTRSLVVLFALATVACGSLVPVAQPPHHPALVLDPHGRPLDTAEVIGARALHLQAKALEGHYAPLAHSVVAPITHSVISAPAAVVSHAVHAPVLTHAAITAPVLEHSTYGLVGHGHYLKKRSVGLLAYSAPINALSAVSHQSRVDVVSSPAVVSHSVHAPVITHAAIAAPVLGHSTYTLAGLGHYLKKRSLGYLAYSTPIIAPSAVSHQSRVDVRSSPAVVSHSVIAPIAHSVYAAPVYGAHGLAHIHLLKKRSLADVLTYAYVSPSAVSHQSRVDVISKPAVVTEVVSAPVLAHVAPLATPLAHSAVWSAPVVRLSHSGLFHAAAAHW